MVDRDGTDLGLMIVAIAQKIASEQGAELFVADPKASPPVVRVVMVRRLIDLMAAEIRRHEQG